MIQPLFNGMLAILLAKFCLNDLPHASGLLEDSGFRWPTGVWYEMSGDRTKIESAPGLLEFIGSVIQSLKEKYGTGPKSIGFARLKPDTLASLIFGDVVVHVVAADMWATDRELTKQALKYVVTHEFGHYMMMSGHVKIPLPKGPKWVEARREWKETYADEFAERESGMSREEANMVTDAIGRKMLGEES